MRPPLLSRRFSRASTRRSCAIFGVVSLLVVASGVLVRRAGGAAAAVEELPVARSGRVDGGTGGGMVADARPAISSGRRCDGKGVPLPNGSEVGRGVWQGRRAVIWCYRSVGDLMRAHTRCTRQVDNSTRE